MGWDDGGRSSRPSPGNASAGNDGESWAVHSAAMDPIYVSRSRCLETRGGEAFTLSHMDTVIWGVRVSYTERGRARSEARKECESESESTRSGN